MKYFIGKIDPYCEISMGSQEHKTSVIANTCNPKWNANMQFFIQNPNEDVLCITVFDKDYFSPNGTQWARKFKIKVQAKNLVKSNK